MAGVALEPDASGRKSLPDNDRSVVGWLLLIILVGLGLRLLKLGSRSFWLDEAYALQVSDHTLREIWNWSAPAEPADPPLYFVLLRGWRLLLGSSEAAVRSLSVLFGTALIPASYMLGRILKSRRVGLVAAALIAVSVLQVRYSQDARMYPLLALLLTIATASIAWLVSHREVGGSRHLWVWVTYAVTAGLSLLTHHTAGFLLLGLNVAVIWLCRREVIPPSRTIRAWFLANLGVVAIWATWIPAIPGQLEWYRTDGVTAFHETSLTQMASTLFSTVQDGLSPLYQDLPGSSLIPVILALPFVYLILRGLRAGERAATTVVALAIATAVGIPLAADLLGTNIFAIRLLSPAAVLIAAVLAAGIVDLPPALSRVALVGVLILSLTGVGVYTFTHETEEWIEATAFIDQEADGNDTVVFLGVRDVFDLYYEESADSPRIVDYENTLDDSVYDAVEGAESVFVVVSHWFEPEQQADLFSDLSANLSQSDPLVLEGIEIFRFGP